MGWWWWCLAEQDVKTVGDPTLKQWLEKHRVMGCGSKQPLSSPLIYESPVRAFGFLSQTFSVGLRLSLQLLFCFTAASHRVSFRFEFCNYGFVVLLLKSWIFSYQPNSLMQLNELVVGDTNGKLYVYKNDDSKPWAVRSCQGMVSSWEDFEMVGPLGVCAASCPWPLPGNM